MFLWPIGRCLPNIFWYSQCQLWNIWFGGWATKFRGRWAAGNGFPWRLNGCSLGYMSSPSGVDPGFVDDLLKVGLFPGQFPRLHLSPPAGRNSNVAGNRNFSTISSRGLREFYGILRSLFDLCVVFSHIRLLKPMFFETEFPWNQGDLPQFYPFIHGIFPRN